MEKTDREGENVMQALFDAVNAICGKIQVVSDLFWEFPTNFGWYAAIPILGNFSLAIILLVGTGIFLTFRFRFVQVRKFKYGLKVLLHSKAATKTGISALAAFLLSTAMRVGPGNILGVTGAISIGGPGALFWMWLSAFFGMSTAFAESTLSQIFKEKREIKNIIMDNLIEAIKQLKKEKNAIILGHYYQKGEIQDIADYVGDSLALAQWAARTEADIIVMCGVHFMGETAKVLCPDKKVLVPDMAAGCSLADSCPADKFSQFVKEHPGYTVISYVNTTAAVKAVTDVVVTSTNAKQIVESFPKDEKIIFGPDRNLGNYINSITGRNMLLWDGACHVHEEFSVEKIVEIKRQHPDAVVLAHPECKSTVLKLADVVGSTAALLKYAVAHPEKSYIVATESGILHEMQKQCPQTTFIPAPPNDSTCACNECSYMRLNTLEKLYDCLKNESPEIKVDAEIAEKAVKPIKRMLEISAQLGL